MYETTAVIKKPTPTKDKPKDTRLYSGKSRKANPPIAKEMAKFKAKNIMHDSPADSLTRAEYKELTRPKVEEPPKKKKKKRRRKNKK